MDRRKLMMCTDIGLFGVSMTLALLTLAGKASPGLLYTATALLAIFKLRKLPRGNQSSRTWYPEKSWRKP